MKINASSISMASARSYQRTEVNTILSSTTVRKGNNSLTNSSNNGASLDLSEQGLNLSRGLRDKLRLLDGEAAERAESSRTGPGIGEVSDGELEILRRILEFLRRSMRANNKGGVSSKESRGSNLLMPSDMESRGTTLDLRSGGSSGTGTVWTRTVVASSFVSEQEVTCFSANGAVQTADGRTIDFQVDLEMSRSFMEETIITDTTEQILCDPLVINMDAKGATVTDQKFYFDLDADGTEDEVSFVGEGSGFLALDKNGDGEINDGSELFGTKSGDGFADLAAYDSDRNGWIDENDEVFQRLKVWTKDEDGNDVLMDLKKADVGAIYLGNVSTEFSLNSLEDNRQNGVIRSTGIYLKESSGAAFTVQHVDLAL